MMRGVDNGAAAGAPTLADRHGRAAHRWRPRPAACRRRRCRARQRPRASMRPTTGLPAASAMPRAAAMPTRRPVKLPGPTVTAMRSSLREVELAPRPSRARSAASALRRGRAPSLSFRCAMIAPCSESKTAAEQASSAVSMARTRMLPTMIVSPAKAGPARRRLAPASDEPQTGRTLDDVRHEMLAAGSGCRAAASRSRTGSRSRRPSSAGTRRLP